MSALKRALSRPKEHEWDLHYYAEMRRLAPGYLPKYHINGMEELDEMIGDVGFMHKGCFKPLFNITMEQNNQRVGRGVPEGFEEIPFNCERDVEAVSRSPAPFVKPWTPLCSDSVKTVERERRERSVSYLFTKTTSAPQFVWWVGDVMELRVTDAAMVHWKAYFKKHIRSWVKFATRPYLEISASDLVLITGCVRSFDWVKIVLDKPGEYSLQIDTSQEIRAMLLKDGRHSPFQTSHRPTSGNLPLKESTSLEQVDDPGVNPQRSWTIFMRGIRMESIGSIPTRIVAAV